MAGFMEREGEVLSKFDPKARPAPELTPEQLQEAAETENRLAEIAFSQYGMSVDEVDQLIMKEGIDEWDKVFNGQVPQMMIKEVAHPDVGPGDRFVLKNFSKPEEQIKWFKKRGLDASISDDNRVLIREKGKNSKYFHPLDPDMSRVKTENLKIKDLLRESVMETSDIGASFARGLAVGAASASGAAAGFMSPVPGGTLLGAMAGAGLADFGISGVEQAIGKAAGVREEFDLAEAATAGGTSALGGFLFGGGMSLKMMKDLAMKMLTKQIRKATFRKLAKGEVVNKLGGRLASSITGYHALQNLEKAVIKGNRGLVQGIYRGLTRDFGAGVPAMLTGTKKDALINYVRKYDKMTSIHQDPKGYAGKLANRVLDESESARKSTGKILGQLRSEYPDAPMNIRPLKDTFEQQIMDTKEKLLQGNMDVFDQDKLDEMEKAVKSIFYRKKIVDDNFAKRMKISNDNILPYKREEKFNQVIKDLSVKKKAMGLTKKESENLRNNIISRDYHHTDKYAPFLREEYSELPDQLNMGEHYQGIRNTINSFNDFYSSSGKDPSKLTPAEREVKDLGRRIYHQFESLVGDSLKEVDEGVGETYKQAKDLYIKDMDRSDYLNGIFGVGKDKKRSGDIFEERARYAISGKNDSLMRHLVELDNQKATLDFDTKDLKTLLNTRLNTNKFDAPIIKRPQSLLDDANDLFSYEAVGPTGEDLGVIAQKYSGGNQKAREASTALGQMHGGPTPAQARFLSRLFGDRPRGTIQAGRGLRAVEQKAGDLRRELTPDFNRGQFGINPATLGVKAGMTSPWASKEFDEYLRDIRK